MAKSLRSKWKKRMRAVKRVKYGERELERLKATIANDIYNKKPADDLITDISDIATGMYNYNFKLCINTYLFLVFNKHLCTCLLQINK
jgi:hypothetical protein